jgi:tRNA 2-selenouridine synthase
MTSDKESSKSRNASAAQGGPFMQIESLAGTFHPHAIEVQDFDYYTLVIDVRSRVAYEDDHIPGAVHLEPPPPSPSPLSTRLQVDAATGTMLVVEEPSPASMWPALEALVAGVRLNHAILVYCGRGSLDSTPVARALRWRGWTVDVLGGGWINYRRWVQAGMEVLPRMVAWRVVACTLGSQSGRMLQALRRAGHQVLDLEALATWWRFAFSASKTPQPAQAWFESLVLRELRSFDPRRQVWVGDVGATLGAVSLSGSLRDALAIAPAAKLDAPVNARVQAWMADEPLCADLHNLFQQLSALDPAPPHALLSRWRAMAAGGHTEAVLAIVLQDWLDSAYARDRAPRSERQHALPPFVVETFDAERLLEVVRERTGESTAPPPAT